MRYFLKKYFIVTVAIFAVKQFMPGFTITDDWNGLFYASLILGILIFIAKPFIDLVTLPINILSLNLFSWLMNIAIVYIWSLIAGNVKFSVWDFPGFVIGPVSISPFPMEKWQVIIVSGIILTLIIRILDTILK